MSVVGRGATAAAAAACSVVALRTLSGGPPGGAERWTRRNYRDRPVSLLAGPAVAAGALAGATLAGLAGGGRGDTGRLVAAVATAAALGIYDDLAGGTHARGLRGHFSALARGEVTTGIVKMSGLAVAGLVAAPSHEGPNGGGLAALADGALIAGTANLVNLLDLRPGRALKAVTAVAVPLAMGTGPAAAAAAAAVGTASAVLPGDLGERHMIGDCGANALGALAGWAMARAGGPGARLLALATVVGLTLASERISFSAAIDAHPLLAAVDGWGRLPG